MWVVGPGNCSYIGVLLLKDPSPNCAPHPGRTGEHSWVGVCPVSLCLLTIPAVVPVHTLTL